MAKHPEKQKTYVVDWSRGALSAPVDNSGTLSVDCVVGRVPAGQDGPALTYQGLIVCYGVLPEPDAVIEVSNGNSH